MERDRESAPTTQDRGSRAAVSDRREEILQIAAAVFASKGIAGATVRDIAQEAGILSGSLYHHFESKDQIVEEILEREITKQQQWYEGVLARVDDPVEVLREFFLVGIRAVGEGPHQATMLRNEAVYLASVPRLAEVAAHRQRARELWLSVVRKGIDEGVFRGDLDADVAVRAMFDALLGSTRWLPPRGNATPERIGHQLSGLFLDGLRS